MQRERLLAPGTCGGLDRKSANDHSTHAMSMTRKLLQHPLTHVLTILLVGVLAYSNSFRAPFVFDDLESIPGNEVIRDLGNFLPGGPGYDFLFRRWIGYFTFALNYRFGGLDVTGYHLFNLAVHLCNASLVLLLVRLTFRTPFLAGSRIGRHSGTAGLLAALFFVAHPVQTQAVTYIFQRMASLCTLFYLLALALYVAARVDQESPRQEGGDRKGPVAGGWRPLLLLAASVTAAVLAMQTKEIAFTLPLAALLYEFCFFRGGWRRRSLVLLPLLLTLAIIPLMVLAEGQVSADLTLLSTRTHIPRSHYVLTQLPVLATYLRLLVLPVGQNLDYDYPVYTTFFTPPVFLAFLLAAAIGALAGILFHATCGPRVGSRSTADPAVRFISFGLIWFFLTLTVEAGVVPLADVIYEHRLYLPSVGLAAALATAVVLLSQRTTRLLGGRLPLFAAAAVIVALTVATWQRNHIWQSEVRLWEDVTHKSPRKARPWYNLGTYLTDGGRPVEAIPALLRAVTLDPQYAAAWHNLGRAYLMTGRNGEALPALRTAVRLNPEMDNAAVNLSGALINARLPWEAVPVLESVRRRSPDWPEARFNLGLAYLGIGNREAARSELAALRRIASPLAAALAREIGRATANARSE